MAIPASQIVQVNPRIISAGASNLDFNGLLLTRNSNIPVGQVLQFSDIAGVQAYLGIESQEASLATVYFNGYDNSFIKPRKLFIAGYVDAPVAAWLRGAKMNQTLTQLNTITGGTFTINTGEEISLTDIDLSTATSFSDAANILQAAIREAGEGQNTVNMTVQYSSLYNAFIITGSQTGEDSTMSFAGGTVADALNLTEAAGAIISAGSDAITANETMEGITAQTQNWVNFTTAWQPSQEEVLAFAGLEQDQRNILWVRHSHANHHELHFVIPRVELYRGKAYNPCPPGWQKSFDVFRDLFNTKEN